MRNPGFVRIRRMQPRYKYKQHSLRAVTVPTPRNILALVVFVIIASVWCHKIGLFASSDLAQPSSGEINSSYAHGSAAVERVIWYEGDSRTNQSSHASQASEQQGLHHTEPQSHVLSPPNRIEIQVESLDPKQIPSQDQRPDQMIDRVPEDQHHSSHSYKEKLYSHETDSSDGHSSAESLHLVPSRPTETSEQAEDSSTPVEVQLKPLKEVLRFTPSTAINFMHFHKTGGVSFKTSLHKFYHNKNKQNGEPVRVRDACYTRQGVKDDPSRPTFLLWRCDWQPLREMTEEERNKHDFIFGHQYWGNGAGELLNKRDLRSFTILRHPFDRKVSFYYHFFVREVGRKEEDVTFEDIRDFLLYDKLTIKADLGRDLGPNYMAGRLLSDGTRGFVGNRSFAHYSVEQGDKQRIADEAKKLLQDYVFVGIQKESNAAKCMLRKVVETFNDVNGINNDGVELIDKDAARLNRGSYSLDAKDIWQKFTPEERVIFDKKERVDLLIYEEGERLFREHIRLFGCKNRVEDPKYN